MSIKNCRTTKNRDRKQEIIDRYDLIPGSYCKVLPHQVKEKREGCCGSLTDKFFQFYFKPKRGFKPTEDYSFESGSFFVGHDCGLQFIEKLKQVGKLDDNYQIPTCFNPLQLLKQANRNSSKNTTNGITLLKPTQLNTELKVVLGILAQICRTPLRVELNEILLWLHSNPYNDNEDWAVCRINNAIKSHAELNGKTLRQAMQAEEQLCTQSWRQFTFLAIERVLRSCNHESFIDPDVEFIEEFPEYHYVEVVRKNNSGNYKCLADDSNDEIWLFSEQVYDGIAIGDWLKVRLGETYIKVKGAIERFIPFVFCKLSIGYIKYIDNKNNLNFAFMKVDDCDNNIFIPKDIYEGLGCPEKTARLTVMAVETDLNQKAIWGRLL